MLYCNRSHAGEQLAVAVRRHTFERPLVLALSRGGVPVAIPVARSLGAQLGLLAATKLRAPWNPEVAIGAITADGLSYVEGALASDPGLSKTYLDAEKAKQRSLARQRASRFGDATFAVKRRCVILVDDGIASFALALAAIRSCRVGGAMGVWLAVPVALPSVLPRVRREVDELICLKEDPQLFAVGEAYGDFQPVGDGDVDEMIRAYRRASEPDLTPHQEDPTTPLRRRVIDWFQHAPRGGRRQGSMN
jgi:putative phosphoribosyl transferase